MKGPCSHAAPWLRSSILILQESDESFLGIWFLWLKTMCKRLLKKNTIIRQGWRTEVLFLSGFFLMPGPLMHTHSHTFVTCSYDTNKSNQCKRWSQNAEMSVRDIESAKKFILIQSRSPWSYATTSFGKTSSNLVTWSSFYSPFPFILCIQCWGCVMTRFWPSLTCTR